MAEPISIEAFRELFDNDTEFAVIDPRAADEFARGHMLAASNLPLADLAQQIGILVPRTETLCVLCDKGAGEVAEAAASLQSLGYTHVSVLEGGLQAWQDSGAAVFSGVSVPGKAFGEYIEQECATPAMTAAQLQARQQAGNKVLLLDSRTAEEHASYCIPGAILCPGAELVYRVPPIIEDDTDIVVHCGGRRPAIGEHDRIQIPVDRIDDVDRRLALAFLASDERF